MYIFRYMYTNKMHFLLDNKCVWVFFKIKMSGAHNM